MRLKAHAETADFDKLARNPALSNINLYQELEIFKGEPPKYDVKFNEIQ